MADRHLSDVRAALAARYRIEQEIGRGGAARVYLAHDLSGGGAVAIKVLREELAAAVARDRFRREIALAGTLHHPNILPILTSDELGGVLFCVMPYVAGESLRQRLLRERQLPVADAVRITREIASGLAAAHRVGVVHRDIKPENILLSAGHAVVADFGIARAITEAAGDRLTSTGIAIGTPGYMSPEQATGEPELDQRSDVYSLGCVLYEMLAGETPYTGPSAQAIVAKQIGLPIPSARIARDTVPRALDRALRRALAKVPADRFGSVEDFAAALTATDAPPTWRDRVRDFGPRRAALVGAGLVVAATAGVLVLGRSGRAPPTPPAPDTTRYLVLPLERSGAVPPSLGGAQLLHDALVRWRGLTVVDAPLVEQALRHRGTEPPAPSEAADLARGLGAGRILRAAASPLDDSVRIRVGLYDAAGQGPLLAERIIRVSPDQTGRDSAVAAAVDYVLFRGVPPPDAPSATTTRSLPARQAFAAGMAALERWDLARADSAFATAVVNDDVYPQAQLWLAVARSWSGAPPPRWRVAAEQAVLRGPRLDASDRAMAAAVLAEARGEWDRACAAWRDVSRTDPDRFAAWYGLARCLATDNSVVRDAASASGWRFRTSYHAALQAYQRAFALEPAILASFRPRSFEWLRYLFKTGGNELRAGRAVPPDTLTFLADPEWAGDTLAYVPYPWRRPRPRPPTKDEALRRLRRMFRDVAMTWVAAAPRSASGLEALAVALAMVGDRAALDTLRRAATLATDPANRFRIATSDVWVQLGFALPDDAAGVERVRHLADSLLVHPPPDGAVDLATLASLAALTGRAGAAAGYAVQRAAREEPDAPLELRQSAPALLMFAAMGGPVDSLIALEPKVQRAIERALAEPARGVARDNWLVRPATLAFPAYRFASVAVLAASDPILRLQAALDRGDTAAVWRGLRRQAQLRQGIPPADLTFDGLYPEADLLVRLGAFDSAAAWLDPTLGALQAKAPDILASPEQAACLVRVMALRAVIADRLRDTTEARRWAGAVVTLWSGADPFLQPFLARQRTLAK